MCLIKENKFLWKTFLAVENFLFLVCAKFSWSNKFFCGKSPWLRKSLFILNTWLHKISLTGENSLIVENFLDSRKFPQLWKILLIVENFLDCRTSPWLWKISLIVEIFLDWEKFPWLWKMLLIAEYFLDCGKFPWLWKTSLIGEIFFDCGKLTFLVAEKITVLLILKTNADVKTIKTYVLNPEQKLSLLVFFAVNKISIIFSRWFKHKY